MQAWCDPVPGTIKMGQSCLSCGWANDIEAKRNCRNFEYVAVPRNHFIFLVHKGLLAHSSPFVFVKRSRRVQNFSQLGRYSQIIFPRNVTVNAQSHLCIAVSKPLLPQFQRSVQPVHHRGSEVPERVQSAALDTQLLEERMQLSLHEKILVERRSVSRGEEQATRVRAPLQNESSKVLDQIR